MGTKEEGGEKRCGEGAKRDIGDLEARGGEMMESDWKGGNVEVLGEWGAAGNMGTDEGLENLRGWRK